MNIDTNLLEKSIATESPLRNTSQYVMPANIRERNAPPSEYDIYPVAQLGVSKIFDGYDSLGKYIAEQKTVIIDGYVGVNWDEIRKKLQSCFDKEGYTTNWIQTLDFLKSPDHIRSIISPFLGEQSSVWGTRTTLTLSEFFDNVHFENALNADCDINVVFGIGASLCQSSLPIIYLDVPKNEIQFRMRAGSIFNLGSQSQDEPFQMYKRFYFVDWVVLNSHKKNIFNRITIMADTQWEETLHWTFHNNVSDGLKKLSESVFRVRPWFEPGAWGGQWMKENIDGLNPNAVNLAWSFELIVPENGLVFESDGNLLEVTFDSLLFCCQKNVLGKHAARFGDEFPIRFDFLDTYKGGNLSIQCHPRLKYIQENFGETITQDETYYILEADQNASVYLGFQEDIDPVEFRKELERSQTTGEALTIENFVQVHPAQKHDLFLIPNGTVHSAGAGNVVLEISATPYIFTFKMYDWVRLDLDGKPRPINIDHAFKNLNFDRKGDKVKEELISQPRVIQKTDDYVIVHLPTHPDHFYDVMRLEFDNMLKFVTANSFHVLMLVEGEAILIETENGTKETFAYAETFVVPAAANSYTLKNLGSSRAKIIKAFIK
ncbi:class I mannose-6-phosphate isomerase [Mucilaginibacter ginkgonis]|uniref:Class I mannose-6-phosphate isomerase n=1 Tax=Mucilaginibacter ginkgonis TaxID=2682091 RepID=A0A6I4IMW6_9SPHI|nr:class I mannose-6-phosphate isomerase [Mucilaginibacter ginkgonis]QQL49980.1 class I mannose-6-phosphate isomerase [Mucilaginibacter ginkgonis]